MRKVIYAINMTIEGCCDHTKLSGSDEIYEYYTSMLKDVDGLLYGRKTYQLMVPFWPEIAKKHSGSTKPMNDFAQAFDSVREIIVISQTLGRAEEKNTKIIRANLQEEILKLKHEPGKDILTGGVNIPTQLIQLGLVDELRIVIQPIVVGEGVRLLEGVSLPQKLQFNLINSRTFQSGSLALRYLKS
ncbi:MAG TPA: dihydrofolate reductase family protein [Puia sp.]|nr:dihydrofolate reductase family protein [Puia sp.]